MQVVAERAHLLLALQQMRHYNELLTTPAVRGTCVALCSGGGFVTDRARVALRVVLVALIPITLGCARLAPELIASATHHASAIVPSNTEPPVPRVFEPPREGEDDGELDLYGNDVTDAVAKYKLDSDGSLYELHSPQTQIPRLGSAKS
jgi:hypothetical protein